MASRRFFAYDPYDYYYTTSYHYPYPYYYHHHTPAPAPTTSRSDNAFSPAVGSAEPAVRAAAHQSRPRSRSVSVPVYFVGSDPETEPKGQELRAPPVARTMAGAGAAAPTKKRAPSAEEAAVRVQAAARGFLARRMVREVRAVEREADGVAARVAAEAEELRGDARARVAVGEAIMRLLLRLDAVHGAREYRRRVTKRVLALQNAVDALEPRAAAAPAAIEMAETHAAEEGQMAPELPDDAEHGVEIEANLAVEVPATETAAEIEVDGVRAIGDEADPDVTELVVDGEKPEEAEGEWEMVTEESAAADAGDGSAAPEDAERRQEPAGEEEEKKKSENGAADGLDARKVMEMVAALCERSAQQCAVIGALAERVDALERAVRRVEEADRRRRRNKKLKEEGKGNTKYTARSCYSN